MQLLLASDGPSTSVLAYNGDSARGWNDPPTFAFSGNKSSGSRPKLDLRKRVSHQQALHGTRTPPLNPSSPTTYGGNEVSDSKYTRFYIDIARCGTFKTLSMRKL